MYYSAGHMDTCCMKSVALLLNKEPHLMPLGPEKDDENIIISSISGAYPDFPEICGGRPSWFIARLESTQQVSGK